MVQLTPSKRVFIYSAVGALLWIVVLYFLKTRSPTVIAMEELPAARAAEELPGAITVAPTVALQEESPDCCHVAAKQHIDSLCALNESIVSRNCSCTDYMLCKLVVVTALSSNHFLESQDFLGSVLEKLPSSKVIVYDLGLTADQVHRIQSCCNVLEVRKFNFNKYPPHTKDLLTYAWKPFLVKEVSKEYELFFYCDASCRVQYTFIAHLPDLLHFPLKTATRLGHSVVRSTHDGMLKYLAPDLDRAWLVNALPNGFEATGMLFLVNDFLKEKFLTHWVDCAEHKECIAPKGARLLPCDFNTKPDTAYVGCHRYDQSALNVILIREFGSQLQKIFDGDLPRLVEIYRRPTKQFDNSMSRDCGIEYINLRRFRQLKVTGYSYLMNYS